MPLRLYGFIMVMILGSVCEAIIFKKKLVLVMHDLSCRKSDLQFPIVLQTRALVL